MNKRPGNSSLSVIQPVKRQKTNGNIKYMLSKSQLLN